jgi:uncharacterized protein YbjT (DUF2867 family)
MERCEMSWTVAVAGASGFVGSRLAEVLAERARVVGLTRGGARAPGGPIAEWRSCDLFSYEDALAALRGVDVAFYLVHAMMPAARLTQARFEDLDAISADNFARAAKANGVRQIVYLGGLVPGGSAISRHLASRREVERVLAAHGVPVTVLRASMIVGPGGSSLEILIRLVKRLRYMLCPAWMRMRTQPIDLEDVAQLLAFCAGREETFGKTYDVGGPDVMSYQEMVEQTAAAMGRKRVMIPVPLFTTGLSCLWVSLVTGAPRALVRPLIDSLNHETVAGDQTLQELAGRPGISFRESLARALAARQSGAPRAFLGERTRHVSDARSVQRLPLPPGFDANRVAQEYERWLLRVLPILRTRRAGEHDISFTLAPLSAPLLALHYDPDESTPERSVMYVVGGALARPSERARLEFLCVPSKPEVLAAVHDFHPRLPWWLYVYTQAPIHHAIMLAFGRHLGRS